MRTLWHLIVCPECKGDLLRLESDLRCTTCNLDYPIVDGVPVLLPGAPRANLVPRFESALPPRPGYSRWKERLLIKSLRRNHVALDFGCGYQALDDPNIVRMDACLHPYADVVGDVHKLPFRDGAVQLAFGGAVFEHLRDPWQACSELARVISGGGFLYADWNFVFAYHGYPGHYFNASVDGVREVFARHLEIVEIGVAPFQGPGAALRQVIGTYLAHSHADGDAAQKLKSDLDDILLQPLEQLDSSTPHEHRHRTAAGVYVLAAKKGRGPDAVIPDAVWERWSADLELRARFPEPLRLAEPGNILRWFANEQIPETPGSIFSKDGSGRSRHPVLDEWPDELMTEPEPHPGAALNRELLARRRPVWRKVADAVATPADVLRLPSRLLRWLTWRLNYARGRTP